MAIYYASTCRIAIEYISPINWNYYLKSYIINVLFLVLDRGFRILVRLYRLINNVIINTNSRLSKHSSINT